MTRAEQERGLRALGEQQTPARFRWGATVATAACLAAGVLEPHPFPFVVAAFAGFLAVALWETTPHAERAAAALDRGTRTDGHVDVEVEDDGEDRRYFATVDGGPLGLWRFPFQPTGWEPVAGRHAATVRGLPGIAWPALAQTEAGLVYPKAKPVPVTRQPAP